MKFRSKKTGEVISFESIMIDSAKLSAHCRKRYYWTNWEMKQPEDNQIYLENIIEDKVDEKYYIKCETLTKRNVDILTANRNKSIRLGHYNSGGQGDRIYSISGKSVTLSAMGGGRGAKTGLYKMGEWNQVRKLTPKECERLQGLKDDYTKYNNKCIVSDSQRYKGCGNGWTVDVITHIFKGIK